MSISNEIQRLQSAKANIKSAIEQKGVVVGDGTIDTYAEKISEISGGSGVDLGKLCSNIRFENLNVIGESEIVVDLENASSLEKMFYLNAENTTVEHITVNCPNKIKSLLGFCDCVSGVYDYKVKHITLNCDTADATDADYCFDRFKELEIIDGTPIDFSSCTRQIRMYYLNALREVRFKGTLKQNIRLDESGQLSNESVDSIINALADLTGQSSCSIQFNNAVGNKLTDTQKATITAKNWKLVY